jgi:hypothetical protein
MSISLTDDCDAEIGIVFMKSGRSSSAVVV